MRRNLKQLAHWIRDIDRLLQFKGPKGFGRFRGIYPTIEAALATAPAAPIGYDHPQLALSYQQMLEQENWEGRQEMLYSYDYPVLFWLSQILQPKMQLLDLGGNVGIHYYAYQRHLTYPEDLRWKVCELPAFVEVGTQLAQKRKKDNLSFTTVMNTENIDILLASGSLQYFPQPDVLLKTGERKPKHLLLNRLPLHEKLGFVTLQNGGGVFYAQYVFHYQKFIEGFMNLGYRLQDQWEDTIDSCQIPFYPQYSLATYRGLYFKREG